MRVTMTTIAINAREQISSKRNRTCALAQLIYRLDNGNRASRSPCIYCAVIIIIKRYYKSNRARKKKTKNKLMV